MDVLSFKTPDLTASNIDKIAQLFPSAITEMRDEDGQIKKGINFEILKQLLSPDVVDGDECYEFTWVGKKAAMAEAARPITKRTAATGTPPKTCTSRAIIWKFSNSCRRIIWARSR